MAYLVFAANPTKYDVERAILGSFESWRLGPGRSAKAGDKAAIWKYRGRGKERGVVAFAEVVGPTYVAHHFQSPHWLPGSEALQEPANTAPIRLLPARNLPLWVSSHPRLMGLSVARAQGGTVFHLSDDEWQMLVELAGGVDTDTPQEVTAAQQVLAVVSGKETGQGLNRTLAHRRCVEDRAMVVATDHMRNLGWTVEDVHLHQSFDLACRRGAEELCLEVKGTVGHFGPVFVTALEVKHAIDHPEEAAMAIVSDITVATDANGVMTVSGGSLTIMRPWAPLDGELTALAYKWSPPLNSRRR